MGDDRAMDMRDTLRVPPGQQGDLAAIDPSGTPGMPHLAGDKAKGWARNHLDALGVELASHQERLYASAKTGDSRRRLLLVLQAVDCGGEGGETPPGGGCGWCGRRWTAAGRTGRPAGWPAP